MRMLCLLSLTLLSVLTSRWGYTEGTSKQAKALEEVRGLLKKLEKNSAELQKRSEALASAQADEAIAKGQKPGAQGAPANDCMKLSDLAEVKDCLIKKITETQAAQKELLDSLD